MAGMDGDYSWKQAILACVAGTQTDHFAHVTVARTMNAPTLEVGDAFLRDATSSRDGDHQVEDGVAVMMGVARIS